jgi:competence ComEA-like helix-hairpin-helix protein
MRARFALIAALFFIATTARAAPRRELEGVINLNTASGDELRLLSGVGPAKVESIIAYRTKHPFRTVDELVRIQGIGRKMVHRLRLHLAVSGPTTAQQVIRASPSLSIGGPPDPPPLLRRPVPALPPRPVPGSPLARRLTRPSPYPAAAANHCVRKP